MKTTIQSVLITFALVCFALHDSEGGPSAAAPDGGYPGANTAEGDNALFNLTTRGIANTAVGSNALHARYYRQI